MQHNENHSAGLCALQLMVPKAGKADIWRLAITLRYGGIYADSDVKALHPFRDYVLPNASVASGMGRQKRPTPMVLACHSRALNDSHMHTSVSAATCRTPQTDGPDRQHCNLAVTCGASRACAKAVLQTVGLDVLLALTPSGR